MGVEGAGGPGGPGVWEDNCLEVEGGSRRRAKRKRINDHPCTLSRQEEEMRRGTTRKKGNGESREKESKGEGEKTRPIISLRKIPI